jgi:hypothetical protein
MRRRRAAAAVVAAVIGIAAPERSPAQVVPSPGPPTTDPSTRLPPDAGYRIMTAAETDRTVPSDRPVVLVFRDGARLRLDPDGTYVRWRTDPVAHTAGIWLERGPALCFQPFPSGQASPVPGAESCFDRMTRMDGVDRPEPDRHVRDGLRPRGRPGLSRFAVEEGDAAAPPPSPDGERILAAWRRATGIVGPADPASLGFGAGPVAIETPTGRPPRVRRFEPDGSFASALRHPDREVVFAGTWRLRPGPWVCMTPSGVSSVGAGAAEETLGGETCLHLVRLRDGSAAVRVGGRVETTAGAGSASPAATIPPAPGGPAAAPSPAATTRAVAAPSPAATTPAPFARPPSPARAAGPPAGFAGGALADGPRVLRFRRDGGAEIERDGRTLRAVWRTVGEEICLAVPELAGRNAATTADLAAGRRCFRPEEILAEEPRRGP